MITTVEILGVELNVEWSFKITSRSYAGRAPSLDHPGDLPEPAEFEVYAEGISQRRGPDLLFPAWLKEIVEAYLYGDDEVYRLVQEASESEGEYEPDDLREPD